MTLIRYPGRLFQIELRRNATWAVLLVIAGQSTQAGLP
jgi:hypothetical protein